jgi:polar amino acid transport system substrate-binding protein
MRHLMATSPILRLAGATTLALTLAACGGSSSSTTSTSASPGGSASSSKAATVAADSALAAKVPAAISSDGTITVGTDATYAPSEFLDKDGKTVIGFDVDLFKAVAAKLGLKASFTPAPFGAIIPGVSSGKYEAGVSSFTVNGTREKQANMVSYFSAGTLWATKKGDPTKITPDSACGRKVAVQKATVQVDDLMARSGTCRSAGKPGSQIDQYQGQDQATAAVVSGKDEAMLADSPVIAYAVQQTHGQLEKLGSIYDSAPYGYVVQKKDTAFADALAGALAALVSDGTYQKVLDSWNVGDGAIPTPQVNPSAAP